MKLSVIIPTLNERDYLTATVRSVRENATLRASHEIIVVDSGSTDNTPGLAMELGLELIQIGHETVGRAHALNRGALSAKGDVFLFLDADTILPPGYDEAIHHVLKEPETIGGAFEFSLDGSDFGLRVVEIINRLRYRISNCYYGDQGIFVRASAFQKLGGYPERSILEAADFCSAMKRLGKLALIHKNIKTSPRRFIEGGVYRVLANDIKIWWLKLLGKSVDLYADQYWLENLGRGNKK